MDTAAILKNAIFVMFGHFFETVTWSNIFADIKIYQIRSRNLICLIWRRKIIFSFGPRTKTLGWSKSSHSFSSAHSSCISQSINTIFVPHIGMYIRINMSKTDFIYLKIWCDIVTFCQRGHFFYSPCTI